MIDLPNDSEKITAAAQLISSAKRTICFTGAGISTPSGVPDFRSTDTGLWTKDDPMVVASLTSFHHHPERFFNWLRPLYRDISTAKPNPAHLAIADLENRGWIQAIITQNIDNLHQQAGSRNVLELHGSLETITCPACKVIYPTKEFTVPFLQDKSIPVCPRCGTVLKPNIVLFEEPLPWKIWNQAQKYCAESDLIIVVGSSLNVIPAASLPQIAVENGAGLILVNRTSTSLDTWANVRLENDCAQVLPAIARQVMGTSH